MKRRRFSSLTQAAVMVACFSVVRAGRWANSLLGPAEHVLLWQLPLEPYSSHLVVRGPRSGPQKCCIPQW